MEERTRYVVTGPGLSRGPRAGGRQYALDSGFRQRSTRIVLIAVFCVLPIPGFPLWTGSARNQGSPASTDAAKTRVREWLAKAPFDDPQALRAQPNFSYDEWLATGRSLPESIETLIELLEREDLQHPSGNGMRAAYALGWIGDRRRRAVDALLRSLGSSDVTLRVEATAALGRQGSVAVLPMLEKLLTDTKGDVNVRANACISIGRLAPPSGKAILRKALNDRDPSIARAAAEALRILNERRAK